MPQNIYAHVYCYYLPFCCKFSLSQVSDSKRICAICAVIFAAQIFSGHHADQHGYHRTAAMGIPFSQKSGFCLCLGMIGGFIGMTADLFPAAVRRLFVWSYYTGLSPVTYNYVNGSMEFVIREIGAHLPIALCLIGVAVYIAGSTHVSRQEV